jgi:hypothetical protein
LKLAGKEGVEQMANYVGIYNGGPMIANPQNFVATPRSLGDGLQQSLFGPPASNSAYNGMPWFRSAWLLGLIDFWPNPQTQPISGQLFPASSAIGTPGQVMPY